MDWNKYEEAGNLPSYTLTKEANPIWFAKVFANSGKYTYIVGRRVIKGQPTPPRYNYLGRGWKSANTAKKHALQTIHLAKIAES